MNKHLLKDDFLKLFLGITLPQKKLKHYNKCLICQKKYIDTENQLKSIKLEDPNQLLEKDLSETIITKIKNRKYDKENKQKIKSLMRRKRLIFASTLLIVLITFFLILIIPSSNNTVYATETLESINKYMTIFTIIGTHEADKPPVAPIIATGYFDDYYKVKKIIENELPTVYRDEIGAFEKNYFDDIVDKYRKDFLNLNKFNNDEEIRKKIKQEDYSGNGQ